MITLPEDKLLKSYSKNNEYFTPYFYGCIGFAFRNGHLYCFTTKNYRRLAHFLIVETTNLALNFTKVTTVFLLFLFFIKNLINWDYHPLSMRIPLSLWQKQINWFFI